MSHKQGVEWFVQKFEQHIFEMVKFLFFWRQNMNSFIIQKSGIQVQGFKGWRWGFLKPYKFII